MKPSSTPLSPPARPPFPAPTHGKRNDPSYYGVTFLLPRYYHDISGGEDDFIYILSALVGATFIPGELHVIQQASPRTERPKI